MDVNIEHLIAQVIEKFSTPPLASSSDNVFTPATLAAYIDHTLLKPEATDSDIHNLCQEAHKYGFASVCVNSSYVPLAYRLLEGRVKVCSVVGFPLGAMATEVKVAETRYAVSQGAQEIDMVVHRGWLTNKEYQRVLLDIQKTVEAAGSALVKVILEMTTLSMEEKIAGLVLAKIGGAQFVKTSTGFAGGGATIEDISLMRAIVGKDLGVKASGGIRTTLDAQNMIRAGATRLGTSASVAIISGLTHSAAQVPQLTY